MASEVSICNQALSLIGQPSIVALSDSSKQAIECNKWYESERDNLISNFNWNFARKRAALAQDATAPAFEWLYQYVMPSDCLRALEIYGPVDPLWVVEADRLLTDETSVNLVYLYRVTDPNKFPTIFREALSYRLASKIAFTLTNKTNLTETMWAAAEAVILRATLTDAIEGNPDDTELDSSWQNEGRGLETEPVVAD